MLSSRLAAVLRDLSGQHGRRRPSSHVRGPLCPIRPGSAVLPPCRWRPELSSRRQLPPLA
eukprot:scaffold537306_cov14-Prasinocladus_malaysianus.AAC.1